MAVRAFNLPDKGTANNDIQCILFKEYVDAIAAGLEEIDVVIAGCLVSANSTPNLNLPVRRGGIMSNSVLRAVPDSNVTISAANASFPRLDMVVVDSSGALQVRAGTPAAAPSPPSRTSNDVLLATVYVPAAATTVVANQIVDMRVMKSKGPTTIYANTDGSVIANTLTITPFINFTIPAGVFIAGDILRVRAGGWYTSNSGTPTWTANINFGGVTLFADATAATTADVDRGAWAMDFNITAFSNTSQRCAGIINFQTPGAKTAPTTGIAGDLAVVTHVAAPFRGVLGTANTDSTNAILLAQWKMSIANVFVQTGLDYATIELL